ncbi:hypothetical protein Tco_0476140, partial [Tanacetum coccineum]
MGSIDDIKSILTQSALDALCEKFHIPHIVHPELPGRNSRTRNSPACKIGVYTRFFDFANYRIPLSLFLVDVLEYFQINLSQLSVIPAAKISHFEIICRVHNFVPTVGNFQMDLFAFIHHADPTKVRIGEREVIEGEVLLLDLTRGRVVSLAGVHEQGHQNDDVEDAGNQNDNTKDAGNNVAEEGAADGQEIPVDAGIIRIEDEGPATKKAKGARKKRKAAIGASGSNLPPKKLRADHGSSGAGTSTGGKSVAALQGLLERNTFPVVVGVTTVATLPFITSSVSLTPEHEGVAVLILSNVADAEVSSVVRSLVPDPHIMTTTVATTVVADTSSVPVPRTGHEPTHASIFMDSTSAGTVGPDIAGPSQPIYIPKWNVVDESALDNPYVCRSLIDQLAPLVLFSQLRGMDYEQLFAEFNVGVALQTCLGAEVRMRLEHELRGRKKFEGRCAMQADLLKGKDAKIVSLNAQLSLKEAEAAEAIHLRGQVASVESVEATRVNELNVLKERNSTLEEEKSVLEINVATLESADATKLSVKASSLEAERDRLVGQVSLLEGTCSELRDEVSGYKLFKEQIKAVQDEQVKVLSDKLAGLDADLMRMALHLDEEFYPRLLTTIAGWRWILSRVLRLVVMKCLQSLEYLAALGG